MTYKQFKRFSLDQKNEREVLDLAITRAYQASGGELNAFNAGSPLVTLLESLTSAHLEFLFWLNSLPEAMVLTFLAEALNANRSTGSKSQTTIQITLTKVLSNTFIIKEGTKVFSSLDNEIVYLLDDDLVIPAGGTIGFGLASAEILGPSTAVQANELTFLAENFAYVESVTNPAASTIGASTETLEQVRDRVQTLMSQVTPVSIQDWLNVMALYFPNKASNAKVEEGVLYLFIEDYSVNSTFETYVNTKITALQKALIAPFEKALLQITIGSKLEFNDEQCLQITRLISENLKTFANRLIQPADIYNNFANNFLGPNEDVDQFDVLYYYPELNPFTTQSIELAPYDFIGGQVLRDFSNNYFVVNTSFNIVASALDEAALNYLEYHPVYTSLGPGNYSAGDIVLVSGTYYLITQSGAFNPFSTSNWTVLPTPLTWANDLALSPSDFLIESSPVPGISHGFIPAITYTAASPLSDNWAPISPVQVLEGASISPGQYWALVGLEEVIYLNNTLVNYTVNSATAAIDQAIVNVVAKPELYSSLTRKSKYQIGQVTPDNNQIIVTSTGATANIPTGLGLPLNNSAIPKYGTLLKSGGQIFEVIESFVPTTLDTVDTLLTAGFIKKAYQIYDDFDYLRANTNIPYYFDVEFIYFNNTQNSKIVKKDGANYVITSL